MDFHASLDPGSLEAITKMLGFEALLDPAVTSALTQAGNLLVQTAQDISWSQFQNPTGAFADSLYFYVVSPTEVAIAAGVPYAQRLEYGFSGMTDALGRFYPYWPDYHWAQQALDEDQDLIVFFLADELEKAFGELGGAE